MSTNPETLAERSEAAPGAPPSWAAQLFVAAWPLIYFHELFAYGADSFALGNDFDVNYYRFKVYLLDALSRFTVPLWSPAEAAGFPFLTNPFAQVFYPLNLPLTAFYSAAGGYSPLDHQIFTLLGASIFALGSFRWLRSLGLEQRHALFAACVISISFKIADIFRFPNAVHTAAWLPWVLLALTRLFQADESRQILWRAIALVATLLLLLSGSYIYYPYYALFLVGPYVIFFLLQPLRGLVGGNRYRLGLKTCVLGLAALLVAAAAQPYYAGIYELLGQLQSRSGSDLAFATQHAFGPLDTLGSLVFPRAAQPAGCFYIGILPLLLIALYFATPVARDATNVVGGNPRDGWLFKALVLGWLVVLTYITYGESSQLFLLLWDLIPSFSRLRVWGRMNIVLLPLLAWLLARAAVGFEARLARAEAPTASPTRSMILLGSVYLAILAVQITMLALGTTHPDWELSDMSRPQSTAARVVPAGLGAAVLLIVLLGVTSVRRFFIGHRTALVGLLLLFTAIDLRSVTIGVWANPFLQLSSKREILAIDRANLRSFETTRSQLPFRQYTTLSLSPEYNVSVLPDWHLERYVDFVDWSDSQADARDALLGRSEPQKLFLSPRLDYEDIQSFLDQATAIRDVRSYTGDQLVIDVTIDRPSYLSFIDNWDPHWRARIDGAPASLELLFGTFKAVRVPAGTHRVEFTYKPSWAKSAPPTRHREPANTRPIGSSR